MTYTIEYRVIGPNGMWYTWDTPPRRLVDYRLREARRMHPRLTWRVVDENGKEVETEGISWQNNGF